MKQLSTIFLTLALALALTACGETGSAGGAGQSRPDTNQSQNAQQDNGAGGSWQNGTDTPTQPGGSVGGAAGPQDDGGAVTPDDDRGIQDDARMGRGRLRRSAESTATFHQMLENGYVHDSDGFLNDGENTSW